MLFLYDFGNNKRKVRLRLNKEGVFVGSIIVKKDERVDLRWKESVHGAPSTADENKVTFTFIGKK